MKKKIIILLMGPVFSSILFSTDLGLIGGAITNPSHLSYGLSTSMGFFVPLVNIEFELYRKTNTEEIEKPNAFSAAIKFRPKFGSLWPYAVVGFGLEFTRFNLDFDQYQSFTFLGGGIHYQLIPLISLRGDIRFLNFSASNRTRISGGIFFHF